MKKHLLLCIVLLIALPVLTTAAQTEAVPVEIEAEDGLVIVGDYYVPETIPDEGAPAVLLLHMLGSRRSAWQPFIEPLHEAGYHILNVDMRGHGDTGGARDWDLAVTDIQAMLDWLRAQDGVRTDALTIVGASIGSNLALIGCANDPDCVTAIALSPGLNYAGVMPETSVTEGLSERSALLVGSRGDGTVVPGILQMAGNASGEIGIRIYPGSTHGTNLFGTQGDALIALLIGWLDEHTTAM